MLSMVLMNKRSILTAVLALGLGISALTGCATDSAHSYVTPKDVKTVERPIAQIDDSGIKVPEKRDLKVKLADSDKATKWKIELSDPTALCIFVINDLDCNVFIFIFHEGSFLKIC